MCCVPLQGEAGVAGVSLPGPQVYIYKSCLDQYRSFMLTADVVQ